MIATNANILADYAQVVLASGVILGGIGWLVKHFKDTLIAEIKPNGGNSKSLGDVVLRIENLLADHLEHDKEMQQKAGEALIAGQKQLLDTLGKVAEKKP